MSQSKSPTNADIDFDITRKGAKEYSLQVEARLTYIIRAKPQYLPKWAHEYLLRRLFRYEVLKDIAVREVSK